VLSVSILLSVLLLLSVKFRICGHTAAVGGITGLIFTLILQYETPLLGFLSASILVAGLVASARLILGVQRPLEVYAGFFLGFGVVLGTMLLY